MGYERSITAAEGHWRPSPETPETFLQRFASHSSIGDEALTVTFTAPDTCELRTAATSSGMPDAVVHIEAAGFFLLDNSRTAMTRILFSMLVDYALGRCEAVVVREP